MNNNLIAAGTSPGTGITNPLFKGTQLENLDILGPNYFFGELISNLITLLLVVGVIFFFFMLLVGGIQWIGAGGEKGALEGAKGRITNAIVGIVIMFSAFAIIKLVETFFGITILTLDTSSLIIQ